MTMQLSVTITHRFELPESVMALLGVMLNELSKGPAPRSVEDAQTAEQPAVEAPARTRRPRAPKNDIPTVEPTGTATPATEQPVATSAAPVAAAPAVAAQGWAKRSEPAPVAAAPAPASSALARLTGTAPAPLATQATKEDLMQALHDLLYDDPQGEDKILKVFAKLGVSDMNALKPEQFNACLTEFKAALHAK